MTGRALTTLLAIAIFVLGDIQNSSAGNFQIEESFYLHQLLNVKKLSSETKKHVQEAIDQLPKNLKWFFEPEFCLHNAKYGEYFYVAGIDLDSENRFALTWVGGEIKSNGGFTHSYKTDVVDGKFRVRFVLYNYYHRSFAYWKPQSAKGANLIAALKSGTLPAAALWEVEFVNNNLVFSQNGRRMCSTDEQFGEWRRFVYALEGEEYTSDNLACQWAAKKCPFNQEGDHNVFDS